MLRIDNVMVYDADTFLIYGTTKEGYQNEGTLVDNSVVRFMLKEILKDIKEERMMSEEDKAKQKEIMKKRDEEAARVIKEMRESWLPW